MLQAQASERELIDQFLAALRSLPEVRAELVQAERDGWIPIHSPRQRTYPPDMAQARRNRDVRDAGAVATPSLQASSQQP